MTVKIIRSAGFGTWHVNENEELDLPESLAIQLLNEGIAVPAGAETAAYRPKQNMTRKKPHLQVKE